MLELIRKHAQGWLVWVIVGLISITFALFGINSYLDGSSEVTVAKVNDEIISQAEFQRSFQRYKDNMRSRMGKNYDPTMFDSIAVKKSVLNGLIDQKLLLSTSYDLGQRVDDFSLSKRIQDTAAFQQDGQFNQDVYARVLARAGLNSALYEAQLRTDMLIQNLTNNIQQSVLISQYALDDTLRLEKQTRAIAYGVISAQDQLELVDVSDEQVRGYYDANQSNYMTPESVVVDYIELSLDDLSDKVEIDDVSIEAFYDENPEQFIGPEQRRVSHILIEGDEVASLATMVIINDRIEQGDDFSVLAAEYSQDFGAAENGGDLGFFQADMMGSPAFDDAVFDLQSVGDVSEPVKTESGYHLIKLTELKNAEVKPFSQVRDDVEVAYRRHQAKQLFYDLAEQLADLSFEVPENLDVTAEELGLEIKTTASFSRNGGSSDIASNKKVANAAFSDDVLVNDLNSEVIELETTHLVVIHKNQYTPESQLAYDVVTPIITDQLRYQAATEQAQQQGEDILAQLKSGTSAETLFSGDGWYATQSYGRKDKEISAQVLNHAFTITNPGAGEKYTGFSATNGNYIVIKVSDVKDGNPAEASAEDQDSLQSHLFRIYGNSELQAFVDSLKEDADIKIFDQRL